jgi:integrase
MGGQVWKSLGTDLLERARPPLAAEVSEFELTLAKARRTLALSQVEGIDSGCALAAGKPSSSKRRNHDAKAASAEAERVTSVTLPRTRTPASAAARSQSAPLTLRHLLESWKVKQSRHRTIQTFEGAVNEFHALHGALAAEDITRAHARRYRDMLVERKLSDGTIANRLGLLRTVFRFGQLELIEHILGNPFERIPVNSGMRQRVVKDRRAYSVAELNTVFSSKLYAQAYRPRGQVAEAAYWAPLFGPFVGARIEEVAQLRVEDIHQVNGTWCIRICDVGEDQKIKNLGSYRRVPVHDVLIRCGFLRFVQAQKTAGHSRLFPSLSNANANRTWSNALGKWYARYLDAIGLTDPALDYHSYRYAFKQQSSLCGIPNETRDALVGHWVGNRDAGRTYMRAEERQYPWPQLVSAMKLLRYDELDLSHLFVSEDE